jgi:hypothetical protein
MKTRKFEVWKIKLKTEQVVEELKRTKIRHLTEIECVVEDLCTFIDIKIQFASNVTLQLHL